MPKSTERYEHGLHNEKACDLLALHNEFPDWTITTAFYAALHFVSYKLFPFDYKVGEGIIQINDIEQWQKFKSYTTNKRHELLKDLVSIHCSSISPDYDWLLSISMTARYHIYRHDDAIAKRAVSLMKKIKTHCMPTSTNISTGQGK